MARRSIVTLSGYVLAITVVCLGCASTKSSPITISFEDGGTSPGMIVPASEWKRVVDAAVEIVDTVPIGTAVALPIPSGRGIPGGDVGVVVPCRSGDDNIVCVPRFGGGPGDRGVVGCDCFRVGFEDEPPEIPKIAPVDIPVSGCPLRINNRIISCEDNCSGSCKFVFVRRQGIACRCTPVATP